MISRHTRNRVSSQKVTMYVAIALIVFYFSFVAGRGISDLINPIVKSPIPNGYVFQVQAEEAEKLTPMPSPTEYPIPTMTPSPEPTKAPVDGHISDQEVADIVKKYEWPFSIAFRLAKSENYWNLSHSFDCSRTNTNSNGSTDYGLFQINDIHVLRVSRHGWTMQDLFDCKKNAVIAHEIWSEQGFEPWSAFKNGSYLNHSEEVN